jgi:hypothetical protein
VHSTRRQAFRSILGEGTESAADQRSWYVNPLQCTCSRDVSYGDLLWNDEGTPRSQNYEDHPRGREFAGAIGLLVGIAWPALGLAAASGLVLYFVGAVIGHVRVGDFKGLGPAAFMLCISGACLILRVRGG